jgi:hypothetical protein
MSVKHSHGFSHVKVYHTWDTGESKNFNLNCHLGNDVAHDYFIDKFNQSQMPFPIMMASAI